MKIKKLITATDTVESCDQMNATCSLACQGDYSGAIDCISNAIKFLAHAVQCDDSDIVAKESIANLAVVYLDLKSAHSDCNPSIDENVSVDVAVDNRLIQE